MRLGRTSRQPSRRPAGPHRRIRSARGQRPRGHSTRAQAAADARPVDPLEALRLATEAHRSADALAAPGTRCGRCGRSAARDGAGVHRDSDRESTTGPRRTSRLGGAASERPRGRGWPRHDVSCSTRRPSPGRSDAKRPSWRAVRDAWPTRRTDWRSPTSTTGTRAGRAGASERHAGWRPDRGDPRPDPGRRHRWRPGRRRSARRRLGRLPMGRRRPARPRWPRWRWRPRRRGGGWGRGGGFGSGGFGGGGRGRGGRW